jgi:uncharacterized protein YdaU (DUF1376 family)
VVLPYIQFYPTDYLIDTAHLALDEHGAYLLLILNYWQRGGPLPNDNKKLAGICRTDVEHWLNMRSTLLDFFDTNDAEIVHKRLEQDLQAVRYKSQKASKAGKASARKRIENKGKSNNRPTSVEQPFNHIDTDIDTDISKNNKNPCTKPNGSARANGIDFERFWKHWPIKINKKTAKAAFMRKKFEPSDVDELIADVNNRLKHDSKWKQGFIPHCSTYLNGDRWEDAYADNKK